MNKPISENRSILPSGEIPREAIIEQIERLKRSQLFSGSEKLASFLSFVVDEAINGKSGPPKEAMIGNAIYGREPPYDPRFDSAVRVEARRLRRKLDEYYAGEGFGDPIRISMPTGGYAPIFTVNETPSATAHTDMEVKNIFQKGPGAAVAVMPFRASSGEPDEERLAADLTEALVFLLAGEQGFRVISQRLALHHWRAGTPSDVLAAELGVVGVLQGTVRAGSDMIRVSIEHSNQNGFIAFSDRIDAPAKDREQAIEQIATTIVSRVRFDSSKIREMKLSPGPNAVDAHAKVYRARQLLDRQTPAAIQEALEFFTQVSRGAPDYARGYTGIADSQCDLYRLGVCDRLAAMQAAKWAALKALEIDPESAEAHAALATIHAWLDRDRSAAEDMFKKALSLGKHARTARIYGVFLTLVGRDAEAKTLFRQAREIEPLSVQQDIAEAMVHYQARRFDEMPGSERVAQLPPEALCYTAFGRLFAGDWEGARVLIPAIERGGVKQPDLVFAVAEIEAWLGEPARALRIDDAERAEASFFGQATLWASLGDAARMIAALEKAVDRLELSTAWLRTDIRFDRFRQSPAFAAVIATLEMKLP